MSWTKRQFANAALDEIGLPQSTFSASAEDLESILRRLDSMMADWDSRGLNLSYPLSSSQGNSNIEDQTSVPNYANEAIICSLAIKIAPSYNKQVSRETKVNAKKAYNNLLTQAIVTSPIEKQFDSTLPKGAGTKDYRNETFFPKPTDPVYANSSGKLEFY